MPMGAPQVPSMHARQKSSSDMEHGYSKMHIDPRLGATDQQQMRSNMVRNNNFMQMQFPRYDTELDKNLATSPTLHPHLIAPHSIDQNTLAAFQGEAPIRRPSLAPQLSTTSLPPVRDLIEVANDAQLSFSRRTSSYSSMGGAELTPSRRQSSNSVPQSPMHFSSVAYPSPTGGSHRRQDSYSSLGPMETANSSSYHPRRVPANTHRIPPFPTMSQSTSMNSGMNSSSSIPSLTSLPSLTSQGSFETSAITTPPLVSSIINLDASQSQGELGKPSSHSLYPSVPMSGNYKCTFDGCKAAPFTTQYLLTYACHLYSRLTYSRPFAPVVLMLNSCNYRSHMNVHSSERPHFCPVAGCERAEGGKGFKRKNEMKRHGLVHNSPGYVCPFCPDREHRYPRPDNLQRYVSSLFTLCWMWCCVAEWKLRRVLTGFVLKYV